MIKKCLVCKKKFRIEPYRRITAKYCSYGCFFSSKSGKAPWNKGLKGIQVAWNKGKIGLKRSEETKKKISKTLKGSKHPWITNEWRKGKARYDMRGKNHPQWKGGVSSKNKTERQIEMETLEYKLWRRSVFERDGYRCGKCLKGGKTLQADHIKPWAVFPELRYAIDNGQTLCRRCHNQKTKVDIQIFSNYQPKNFGHI